MRRTAEGYIEINNKEYLYSYEEGTLSIIAHTIDASRGKIQEQQFLANEWGHLTAEQTLFHTLLPVQFLGMPGVYHSEVDWYIVHYKSNTTYSEMEFTFPELQYFARLFGNIQENETSYVIQKRPEMIDSFSFLLKNVTVTAFIETRVEPFFDINGSIIKTVSYLRFRFPETKDLQFLRSLYNLVDNIFAFLCKHAKGIPLIAGAPKKTKRDFWKTFNCLPLDHLKWGIDECGEYGSAENYLLLLYSAHRKHNLTIEELYKKILVLGQLEIGTGDTSSAYCLKELLQPIQKAYINDCEKSSNIASIEFRYFGGLDWEDMRCFQKAIKQDPKLYAELINLVFKPEDNRKYREVPLDVHHIEILQRFYLKAKFCPAETDGHVLYDDLKCWTECFLKQLESNHQSYLFGRLMGRLCAHSPVGNDGYKPCEAVRQIIEEYADDSFIRSYKAELYNIRGAHSTAAERGEKKLVNQFREEADQFRVRYPRTSRIYYELYDGYMNDAASERKRAENSYF